MAEAQGTAGDTDRAPRVRGQIPIRFDEPDVWAGVARWRAALYVALAALAIGTIVIVLWTQGSIFWVAPPSSKLPALFFLIGLSVYSGGIATLLLPWLRRFVKFSQCFIFGVAGAVSQLLLVVLLGMWSNTTAGYSPFEGLGIQILGLLFLWFYTMLPGFLTGFAAFALAQAAVRHRIGLAALISLGLAAVAIWAAALLLSANYPAGSGLPLTDESFGPESELEEPGRVAPNEPRACEHSQPGPSLPPLGCPDPRDSGNPT